QAGQLQQTDEITRQLENAFGGSLPGAEQGIPDPSQLQGSSYQQALKILNPDTTAGKATAMELLKRLKKK
ncbi:hypothetical protein ACFL5L_05450, partial [candidate division KSB1 bacterium]